MPVQESVTYQIHTIIEQLSRATSGIKKKQFCSLYSLLQRSITTRMKHTRIKQARERERERKRKDAEIEIKSENEAKRIFISELVTSNFHSIY